MGIGPKIKEFRLKNGLTQKELAEKLSVTYQAVSRWENDEAEPSFDTLKQMCTLFDCTVDDLFSIEKKVKEEPKEEIKKEETQIIVEKEKEPIKLPIDRCSMCGKNIFDYTDLFHITSTSIHHSGRHTHKEVTSKVICKSCNDKEKEKERLAKIREEQIRKDKLKKKRIHSFIWPGLILLIAIIVAIIYYSKGDNTAGTWSVIIGVGLALALANIILDNNFITDMWLSVSSWGFVKLPGLIFSLSLDGIIWLLTVKLAFWVLGILLAIGSTILATILAMALSVFVYPFAITKNIKGIE